MQGRVKWFSNDKGYGYIVADDGDDHYFNVRDIKGVDLPRNGDTVCFDSGQSNKGLRASSIEIVAKDRVGKEISRSDDRAQCGSCGIKMVPRLVYRRSLVGYRNQPVESICPYCAGTYRDFGHWSFISSVLYCNLSSIYFKMPKIIKYIVFAAATFVGIFIWVCLLPR